MRLLPASTLLKKEWDYKRWKNAEASASLAYKANLKPEQYVLDVHPNPNEQSGLFFDKALELLMTYQIYLPFRMQSKICNETGRITKNVTIIQRILIGPIGFEAAVRVVDTFDIEKNGERCAGFTYATLKGHPECGIITFKVSRSNSKSQIQLGIESWSKPNSPALKLFRPLTKAIQKSSNQKALEFIKKQIKN